MVKPPLGLCRPFLATFQILPIQDSWRAEQHSADIFANLENQRHICKSKQSRHICKSKTYLQTQDNEKFQATIHRGVIVPVPLFIRGRITYSFRISTANSKCKETFESIKLQENLSQYHTSRHSTEKKLLFQGNIQQVRQIQIQEDIHFKSTTKIQKGYSLKYVGN